MTLVAYRPGSTLPVLLRKTAEPVQVLAEWRGFAWVLPTKGDPWVCKQADLGHLVAKPTLRKLRPDELPAEFLIERSENEIDMARGTMSSVEIARAKDEGWRWAPMPPATAWRKFLVFDSAA